jgi:hypothetical protein
MKDHPLWKLFAGACLAGGAFAASCFTILTDESLFAGGDGNIRMSWEVFKQPYYIFTGFYSGILLWAIIGSWLIYSCYILLSVIQTVRHDKGLVTFTYILIGIDSIGNFLYFHALPTLYACLLTGLIFFALSYGGKHGCALLASGLSSIKLPWVGGRQQVAYDED